MSKKPAPCIAIEDDLLATAIGEASENARRRVERHVGARWTTRSLFVARAEEIFTRRLAGEYLAIAA